MALSPTEVGLQQQPPRTLSPKIPARAEDSKHRFSKSRNGCVTCKSRRVKCDETKPTCNQCARRRIDCGGYKMDIRFKTAKEPKKDSAIVKSPGQLTFQASRPKTARRQSQHARGGSAAAALAIDPGGVNMSPQNTTAGIAHSEDTMDLSFLDPDVLTSRSLPTPQSLELLNMADIDLQISPSFSQSDDLLDAGFPLQGLGQLSAEVNAQSYAQDYGPPFWDINYFLEDYMSSLPSNQIMPADLGFSLGTPVEADLANTKVVEDEKEQITMLFLKTTCHNLSIEEETDQNPWKTVIWPMAQQYPALYHALAALTCFHTSKAQPHLRLDGERHLHTSARLLSQGIGNSEIPLDAALAATLALGFAETWDSESPTTGMTHIRGAGMLLQQILSNQATMPYTPEEEARLEFLFNTWTYMDVIARITSLDLCPPVPETLVAATVGRMNFSTSKLDPLMGYATSFFPIIRRVADLICKVRMRNAPRNSPVIISQALELKRNIEDWTPPISLETIETHSQLMTDAIQTAEAYRWSTLSLLYQAVPELPNLTSYGELAQKILVYLATIPLSSPTLIVHILPLIIAGNDAVDPEDRAFVRDRWSAMSQRLVTGIVERALEITEEVWKRRDDFLLARNHHSDALESTSPSQCAASYGTVSGPGGSPGSARPSSRRVNSFPISAAFKQGVDTITRSGCIEYTVRGSLHWLGVMKDWQWQGKTPLHPTGVEPC